MNIETIEALIKDLRAMEANYDPEIYPPVQMQEITALCDAIEGLVPSLNRLQEHLEKGAKIAFQDGLWWLFDSEGEGIAGGNSIRGMLVNLVLGDVKEG